MAQVLVTEQHLSNIADAIRSKNGEVTTYKPGEMANAIDAIETGATNFITDTFTVGNTGGEIESLTIPYTGNGYPIALIIVVEGGAYNSAITPWYSSLIRYAVGQWTFTKSVMTSTPTYTTSGAANQGVTTWIYKNSTSSSTTYSRSSAMNTNVLTSSSTNATGAGATCVRFKGNGTTLSYYTANNTSSTYGLLPSTTYRYYAIYSS